MSQPSREDLVAWLMHDLKGPLTGIRAMAEALEDGVAPDPSAYFRQIQAEVERMTRMVDDITDVAGARGARRGVRTPVAPVLSTTVHSAGPIAQACGVLLHQTGAAGLDADIDAGDLARALTNLVLNAIRYTPAGGTVTMTATAGPGTVVIAVADNCGGISTDAVAHAFEPRWQGPPSTAGQPLLGDGQGLGLTIVRTLVEAHRGDVRVENHGGGCRFLVSLPAAA